MANRYWVGGTGTWSSSNTTNWSTTSGGVGGASVPTSVDTSIFDSNSGSGTVTFTNGGVTVGLTTINNGNITLSLGAAFTSNSSILVTAGNFTTNNYNVTATALSSSNSNNRTISLGSSTVTLSGSGPINFTTTTGLTFNAGTSQINCSATSWTFNGGSQTFYNVSFTSNAQVAQTLNGLNVFNNLSVTGRTTSGVNSLGIGDSQFINGTLTLSAGTNATMRTFIRSSVIGVSYTLTCANVAALTDIDFRDIAIAGAAAPVSGTRLGDCKGNSGITFPAGKTVYWVAGTASWGSASWGATSGGAASAMNFPLAQDTAIFDNALISTPTVTINAAYNIGTIDMSARTSNTMTLATGTQTPVIYGNWINGTGTTLTGTGVMTFAGRGSQTITSAGRTFTQSFRIESPGGSVTLQDAFTCNANSSTAINLVSGTFNAATYSVTLSSGGLTTSGSSVRTIAIGTGTWALAGGSAWTLTGSNITVTGTGTISLTSASAKTFAGGGIQTYPTLNQGGTGTLTVTGNNKFQNLTNTSIGRIQFAILSTNEFSSFSINGISGNLLQLGSGGTSQATLILPSLNMGANSVNAGNNTNLSFTAGSVDYLSISYINGVLITPPVVSNGSFFQFLM